MKHHIPSVPESISRDELKRGQLFTHAGGVEVFCALGHGEAASVTGFRGIHKVSDTPIYLVKLVESRWEYDL